MIHRNTKVITSISIGLFCVSILFCVFFILRIIKQDTYFKDLIHKQNVEQAHRTSLVTLTDSIEKNARDKESLESRIVREEGIIDFLALIESLGKEERVLLTTQSISVEPINTMFESLVIHMSIQGSYESVMQTIKLLERIPYQASIYNLRISKESKEKSNSWGGSFELKVTKFVKI